MIGKYLEALPDEALRRVAKAPEEEWLSGCYFAHDGQRCLVGHACDWSVEKYLAGWNGIGHEPCYDGRASDAYEGACSRFDRPRVVAAIRQRANRILAQRGAERDLGKLGRDMRRATSWVDEVLPFQPVKTNIPIGDKGIGPRAPSIESAVPA